MAGIRNQRYCIRGSFVNFKPAQTASVASTVA